jgi:choice-of-anchor B domain-containing protein
MFWRLAPLSWERGHAHILCFLIIIFFVFIVVIRFYFVILGMKYLLLFGFLLTATVGVAQVNMNLLSRLAYDKTYDTDGIEDTTCANIWGWTNPADGKEYALVGAKHGTSIVDVSNPLVPTEVKLVPGTYNLWKEIKTFQHYAYVVSEGAGHGLKIIDMQNLPGTVVVNTINFSTSNRAHALFIDETQGYLYTFGMAGLAGGGCLIWNLNIDPMNPTIVGQYSANYIHDGYVRNNMLYAGAINIGQMQMIDVTNKSAPVLVGSVVTPKAFTHNTWLNDAGTVCFTTDEKPGSFLAAYDITDPTDIKILDKKLNHTNGGAIGHNVHVKNDWAWVSYYTDGISVFDVHVPDILVEVAYHDYTPTVSGNVFESNWGVYPYFASSTIVGSDIERGLYVFQSTPPRASYVRGTIKDPCGNPLSNVKVKILGTNDSTITDIFGAYKMGFNYDGTYTLVTSLSPYSNTSTSITLVRGIVNNLNIIQPIPTPTISPSGTTTICTGSNITLNTSNTAGSILWYNGTTLVGTGPSSYTTSTGGSYKVVNSIASPPCSTTSLVSNINTATPPSPVISGAVPLACGNQTYTYSIAPIAGTAIIWTVTDGIIISGQGTPNVVIQWNNANATGTLGVTQTIP